MPVGSFRRTATVVALALGLASLAGTSPATAAGPPETELVTYTWSHTAHLATFNFSSSDPDATFECSLTAPGQAPAWEGCASSTSTQYASLAVGDYFFQVRARNAAGVDATPAWRLFNIGVDEVRPDTALTTTAHTTSRDATFSFTSTEPGTFECLLLINNKMQAPDYRPCTSPVAYTGLPDASYEFSVRAVDLHGEYDTTPARHKWLLDATPPETSSSAPTINGASAALAFSSPEGTSQCTLTGPSQAHAWQPCSSPTKYGGLAPGTYTWQVAAQDRHGNVDPTPVVHTWQVLPTTGRIKGARSIQQGQVARFRLSSAHAGSSYQCKLDKGRWKRCKRVHKLRTSTLRPGKHVLRVRVRAGGLTDPTPARKAFRVVR